MAKMKADSPFDTFLSALDGETARLYTELADYLAMYGYNPHKLGANITFKHKQHNKQLAKMGLRTGKNGGVFFALRFSACRGYSKRFSDIVDAYMEKYPHKSACCVGKGCTCCGGAPLTHVYLHSTDDDKAHCGAYTVEIPSLTAEDVPALKRMIAEEHAYLYTHEVNRTPMEG